MLEEKDIQKIGEEVGKVIEQNINPKFDEIRGRLDKIEATMVTKTYLDDKLSDFADNLDAKCRKEDGKVNRLIEILKDKSIINKGEAMQLKDSQVLPQ